MSFLESYNYILSRLETMENGDVVNSMNQHHVTYVNSRGVSVPELKELAKSMPPDTQLANLLWNFGSRETKILSFMLEEPDKIAAERVMERILSFDNAELAEQINMYLLPHIPDSQIFCISLFISTNPYVLQTAFLLASKLYKFDIQIDIEFDKKLLEKIKFFANTENVHLRRAIARALSSYGCRNLANNTLAKQVAISFQSENNIYLRWIGEEALMELEYTGVHPHH